MIAKYKGKTIGGGGVSMDDVNEAIDSAIGDINAILDAINGEVV